MTFLAGLWLAAKKVPAWLWGALGIVLAIGWAWLRGKSAGRASERQKANEEAQEHRQEADEIRQEVEGLSPTELDQRGEPWVRR